ncbi:hypothetical protein MMC13_004921 [Lambiella insularis]|nr:hypothetical protein [Lambiella insularis]
MPPKYAPYPKRRLGRFYGRDGSEPTPLLQPLQPLLPKLPVDHSDAPLEAISAPDAALTAATMLEVNPNAMRALPDTISAHGNNFTIPPQSALPSPTQARPGSSATRKRTLDVAGVAQSPRSVDGWESKDESRAAAKRACNECRQQKLRCDVGQEPFQSCKRCQRNNLECKIEAEFKRIPKRKKHAEMERELLDLRKKVESQHSSPSIGHTTSPFNYDMNISTPSPMSHTQAYLEHYSREPGFQEAVASASLLDLKSGLEGGSSLRSPSGQQTLRRQLGGVILSADRVQDLYQAFFTFYHPYIPLLDADKSPDAYYDICPLLFWTIIVVAGRRITHITANVTASLTVAFKDLLWSTIAAVPQSYHVVKALCILCNWPLPISSTSADPTFTLSGIMMQIAIQIGLQRPSHAQDFSRFPIELRGEELKDRVKTWAACNVVAQRVSTGYGLPTATLYDSTLGPSAMKDSGFDLPDDVDARLRIEIFSDKVTKALYRNPTDPVGLADPKGKSTIMSLLNAEFEELKDNLMPHLTPMNSLYLQAARMHQQLSVFFDSPDTEGYRENLTALWLAMTDFLDSADRVQASPVAGARLITFATNYILQMIVAASFTLLKLLNSHFARLISAPHGAALFTRTITTIRTISVTKNDLPSRFAEVLAQLWRDSAAASQHASLAAAARDSSLRLKVCCRMSMSLVYDSVARWREEFQAKGRGSLESALKNPTNPDAAVESSASEGADPTLTLAPPAFTPGRTPTPAGNGGFEEEGFDPLNWMDGQIDFLYGFSGPSGL